MQPLSPERLPTLIERADRANKMLAALRVETDRGCACVGDALLDELLKQLFRARLVDDKKIVDGLLDLNRHGARLKLAYALGWIGPNTYRDASTVRTVRNNMAHDLDVDSFDHQKAKTLVDNLESLKTLLPMRLAFRRDKFMCAVQLSVMQVWAELDDSSHILIGQDRPIELSCFQARSSVKTTVI